MLLQICSTFHTTVTVHMQETVIVLYISLENQLFLLFLAVKGYEGTKDKNTLTLGMPVLFNVYLGNVI